MIGPNLSEWSLKRPSLIIFLMIIAVAAGPWRSRSSDATRMPHSPCAR